MSAPDDESGHDAQREPLLKRRSGSISQVHFQVNAQYQDEHSRIEAGIGRFRVDIR